MDVGWIAAVSGFAVVMAGTPGPNNTIVTASGANYGFRRTMPLVFGAAIGVAIIFLVAATVGSPIARDPRIHGVVKWVGLVYLLWLAWKIGRSRPASKTVGNKETSEDRPLTLVQGALFQLVNPKLWVMVAGAVATYGTTAQSASAIVVALTFGAIFGSATFAAAALWAWIGAGVGRVIRNPQTMRLFNWIMAGLLVTSLIPVMIE